MDNGRKVLSDITVHSKYAKFVPSMGKRESWQGIAERNKLFHMNNFPSMRTRIEDAYRFVRSRKVLPSMRSAQFAGKAATVNPARIYNCSYLPVDSPLAFSETMFLLLSGCGVGYSVQNRHVSKLPEIRKPRKTRRYLVEDSIEGWAEAVRWLVESFFGERNLPRFDFSQIREKGTLLVTSGGKAPGPEPLRACLLNIFNLLSGKSDGEKLLPIDCHDIQCFIADAVLAGGVRRSAMISLFDVGNEEMLACKTGDWHETHPHRARSNNSAVMVRHRLDEQTFRKIWQRTQYSGSGEPGIFLTNNADWGTNPCGEVSLRPFQFCNLVTIDVSTVENEKDFYDRCEAAATIGTLQASYTQFHYLRNIWQRTTEKDALIGVSMTGIATDDALSLDVKFGAEVVKQVNEDVASRIGINPAARTTCVKPEGTTSCVLGTSSGVHSWYDRFYWRRMKFGQDEAIARYMMESFPDFCEADFYRPTKDVYIKLPIKAPPGAIISESHISLLERVKWLYNNWIVPGHRSGDNMNNVSATVELDHNEWGSAVSWLWANKGSYNGITAYPRDNGVYKQTPFESIDDTTYHNAIPRLESFDISLVEETEDNTNLQGEAACAGGLCEVF